MGMHGTSENSIGKQWEMYKAILKSENGLPILNCIGNHDIVRKNKEVVAFLDGKKEALNHVHLNKSYY